MRRRSRRGRRRRPRRRRARWRRMHRRSGRRRRGRRPRRGWWRRWWRGLAHLRRGRRRRSRRPGRWRSGGWRRGSRGPRRCSGGRGRRGSRGASRGSGAGRRSLAGRLLGLVGVLRRRLRLGDDDRSSLCLRRCACEMHRREGGGGKQHKAKVCHDGFVPRKVLCAEGFGNVDQLPAKRPDCGDTESQNAFYFNIATT